MLVQERCARDCDRHAAQRSLYRHALNALQLASRSGCSSQEMLEVAERCAQLLRASVDRDQASLAK